MPLLRLIPLLMLLLLATHAATQNTCAPITPPYSEDFDSYSPGSPPPCWSVSRNYDLGPAPQLDTSAAFSGSTALMLYSGSLAGSHYSIAIAPPLDATSLNGLFLRLRLLAASSATRLEVGFCQDTGRYTHLFSPIDTLRVERANQWHELIVDLGRYSGTGRRLAFRMQRSLQANNAECRIDNLRIGACGTTQPSVTHIGAHTLTLLWEPYGSDPVNVAYNGITIPNASSPLTLLGLSPSTNYTFSVGCNGNTPQHVSATTLDGPSPAPAWYLPFGNAHLSLLPSDTLPYTLPLQETLPSNLLHIALRLRGPTGSRLAVGVSQYPLEPESFQPIDTLVASPLWQRHLVSLAPYQGNGAYIALKALDDTACIDDIRVAQCLLDSIRLYNLTENSVTLDWEDLTGPSAGSANPTPTGPVLIEYGPPGFTPGTGSLVSASSKPFTLSGLSPSSPYELYIYPSCGDLPCSYDRHSLSTLPHAASLPYCIPFANDGLPNGWVCPQGSATPNTSAFEGSHSLQLAAATVTLPLFSSTHNDTLLLDFYGIGSGALQIGTMDNPYGTFSPTATVSGTAWRHHQVPISIPAGHLAALRCSNTWRIDALSLLHNAVTSVTLSAVDQTNAHLHWSLLHPDSVLIEYKAVASASADFTPGTGTSLLASDSILLSGLSPGTHYAIHISPLSDTAACFAYTSHLLTAPHPVSIPLCENFNSLPTNGYPSTWRRASTLGDYPLASTQRNHSSPRSLYFRAGARGRTVALLPDLDSPTLHLSLSFWSQTTQMPAGSLFLVGHMHNLADWNSFIPTDTITPGAAGTWSHHTVNLGPRHDNVALMLIGGSREARVFIDDLCIEPCAIEDLRTTLLDSTSATITWNSSGTAAVEMTVTGNGTSQTLSFSAPPAVISGLLPDKSYTITVKALCDCGGYGASHRLGYGATGTVASDQQSALHINTTPREMQLPFCATFEGYSAGQYLSYWGRLGGSTSVSDANPHSGYRSLMVKNNTTIVLPPTQNPSALTASLYAFATSNAATHDGALVIGTLADRSNAASFVPADTLHLHLARQWQRLSASLASAPDSHSYIAIRFATDDTCTLFLDNLSVSSCGIADAWMEPGGILQWQPLGNPSAVAIEYGPHGYTRGTGTTDTANTPPYSLTNIPTGSNADIYLTPVCDTTPLCIPLEINLISPASIPYCELFETPSLSGLPEDWSVGRTLHGTPLITTTSSSKVLLLKGGQSTNQQGMAVLPELATDGDSLQLSLSLLTATPGFTRLAVGLVDANGDPNTLSPLDTLEAANANVWHRRTCRLLQPPGQRLALYAFGTSQTIDLWVDSLAVTKAVTPSLAASSARSLDIAINAQNAHLEYGPAGFSPGSGTSLLITSPHHTLDGLTPGQQYWFYSLENGSAPTCIPPVKILMPSEETLPFCLPASSLGQLQLPEFAIDSIHLLHLYLTLNGAGRVIVGVMEHSGDWNSLVPVDTLISTDAVRQQLHISLSNYTGNGRFIGMLSLEGTMTVDELVATTCPWVTATIHDDNSILLQGYGTVEYGPEGFSPGTGTTVTVNASLPLSGLPDTTTFDYYPLCGTATPCMPPQKWRTSLSVELPYCCSFDQGLPPGWNPFGNSTSQAVGSHNGQLEIIVATGQQAGVTLPILPQGSRIAHMEVMLSTTTVALLVGHDTLRLPAGIWHTLQLQLPSTGRPQIAATGNGSVKIRQLNISSCRLPMELTARKLGGGRVLLDWNSNDTDTPFYIQHTLHGQTTGTTLRASNPPMELSLLADTAYDIHVKCDSLETPCHHPLSITTLPSPLSLPYCIDSATLSSMPDGWTLLNEGSNGTFLILPQFNIESLQQLNIMLRLQTQHNSQRLILGCMDDASDPSSFDSLTTLSPSGNSLALYTLAEYTGNGRFLAFHIKGNGWVRMLNLSVSTCAAYNIHLEETEADRALFSWEQQGSPTVSIEYGPTGFIPGSGTAVAATASPLLITGLDPLTDYTFYVSRQCAGVPCRPPLTDTFFTFTPKGGNGCIDYTDLRASYVTCKYGSYNSPSHHLGVIDHGYLSAASRHTVHFDTSERDTRTGGLLRTVPVGGNASVRLGNWTAGGNGDPQAESITYGLTVDSSLFDLLILKYAAVLQDPEHSADLQPRFRLEILNQNDELIDSCGMAFFIANPNLNWNHAANEVLWKDWTTVGMDLSAYNGQTIFIRLTTNDCGEGSHFGYAYFTLECASKRMQTEGCSNVPSNRFTVPSGFNYRWYTNLDPTTISDSASIWVRSDNSLTYYCNLSFIDNPTCNFTMSAFAGARYPLALFDTTLTVADCQFNLTITNRSTISGDGISPIGTGENCESTLWLLPNGNTSSANSLTLHLADTGSYNVTLISGIANDQCLDTLSKNILISFPHPPATLDGRPRRCDNETPDTIDVLNAASWHWDNGNSGPFVANPSADTLLTCYAVNHNGCRDTLTHTLQVFPSYRYTDTDSVCNTESSYLWIDTTITVDQPPTNPLNRTRLLTTTEGCDSLRTLSLHLMPSYYIHHHDTLCHDSSLPFFDTLLTTTGSYLNTDTTAFGCDSLVTMHLQIVPRSYADDRYEVCDSMTWINNRTYLADTTGALDTLLTSRGCDSVVSLILTVHHSSIDMAIDTFCQGSSYPFRNFLITESGYYADTLSSIHGCDSVLAINLTRLDLPQLSLSSDYDCDSLFHHIQASSSVPYLLWNAYPPDTTLDGQESLPLIHVHPNTTTTYTLYADYAAAPHCPTTSSVTLHPAHKPEALLKVNPNVLVFPALDFDAFDISTEYSYRNWYIENTLQPETSRHLHAEGLSDRDTTRISLVVDDGHCSDTAIALLPLLHRSISAPNAFTPDEDNNNTFFFVGKGILRAEIHIYNRIGTLVFHSNDFHSQWDGRNRNGEPCPSGSYVWHIRYIPEAHPSASNTATGTVLLLR